MMPFGSLISPASGMKDRLADYHGRLAEGLCFGHFIVVRKDFAAVVSLTTIEKPWLPKWQGIAMAEANNQTEIPM
ncbi:MAG: hypothetical protein AAF556_00180 [Pseudomonadota bacterium]